MCHSDHKDTEVLLLLPTVSDIGGGSMPPLLMKYNSELKHFLKNLNPFQTISSKTVGTF